MAFDRKTYRLSDKHREAAIWERVYADAMDDRLRTIVAMPAENVAKGMMLALHRYRLAYEVQASEEARYRYSGFKIKVESVGSKWAVVVEQPDLDVTLDFIEEDDWNVAE